MPIPQVVARLNKRVTNRVMMHLAGHGAFVELEHVGRLTGRAYRIPLNGFRDGDVVTCALTYGTDVDWYRNVRAARGCRMRMGREWLTLGAPRVLAPEEGLRRMPAPALVILRVIRVKDFIELPVLGATPA